VQDVDEVHHDDVAVNHDHGGNTSSKMYQSHKSLLKGAALNETVGHCERREGKTPTDRALRGKADQTQADGFCSIWVFDEHLREGDYAENK
jgi:triosephosphate isomerase